MACNSADDYSDVTAKYHELILHRRNNSAMGIMAPQRLNLKTAIYHVSMLVGGKLRMSTSPVVNDLNADPVILHHMTVILL